MRIPAAVATCLTLIIAGCGGPAISTRAAPAPEGRFEFSVTPAAGLVSYGDVVFPGGPLTLSVRRGLASWLDVGLRASSAGTLVDTKLALTGQAANAALLVGAGYHHVDLARGVGPHAAVLLDLAPRSRLSLFLNAQTAWLVRQDLLNLSAEVGLRYRTAAGNEVRPGLCVGLIRHANLRESAPDPVSAGGGYGALCWTVVFTP